MNATVQLRQWWEARDRRERRMLAVMFAMLAAFVAWYGVVVPLRLARDAARAGYDRAAADLSEVQAGLQRIAALQERAPSRSGDAGTPADRILDTARRAGVAVSRHRQEQGGGLVVDIDAVSPASLFGWLDQLRDQHGLAPTALNIATAEGRLRVQAAFEGGGP